MATHVIPQSRIVSVESRIVVEGCINCGLDFGIGERFRKQRLDDHGTFYCPNGHGQHFTADNEAERLRKQVARLQQTAQTSRENEQFHRERAAHERRSAAATRGHLTRLRKRIANGVCPCCTRSFENVRRHIQGQHPEWVAEHPDALQEQA